MECFQALKSHYGNVGAHGPSGHVTAAADTADGG